jgi:hypothetical protein
LLSEYAIRASARTASTDDEDKALSVLSA